MHSDATPQLPRQLSTIGIRDPYKGLDCGRFEFVWPRNLPIRDGILIPNAVGGVQSMSLTLIAVANRGTVIELTYEETVGDPQPFVLTVTSRHISSRTSKPLPLTASDLEAYIEEY